MILGVGGWEGGVMFFILFTITYNTIINMMCVCCLFLTFVMFEFASFLHKAWQEVLPEGV